MTIAQQRDPDRDEHRGKHRDEHRGEHRDRIPEAPGALPLLGHVLALVRDPLAFLKSLPAYGDLVRIRIGPHTAFVATTPELAHQILLDDRTFDKGGPYLERGREVAGNGLSTCPHRDHRRQRRLTQPAFHRARLPTYSRSMSEQIGAFVGGWSDGQVLNVPSEMMRMTARVLLTTVFGAALGPEAVGRTMDDLAVVLAGAYRRMLQPGPLSRLPVAGNRRFHQANTRLWGTVAEVVAERGAAARDTPQGTDGEDLLSMLLAAHDGEGDGQRLSDAELADQTVTFFVAGVETTAMVLSWTLHELARHPEVERRLHDEIDTVLSGRPATYEDLPRLELTGRVLAEILRLYPPAWMTSRIATADTRLGGHPVPSGTAVVLSSYLIHHRADLYPDPERFDPDRWIEGIPRGSAYIPFGNGARKCIADSFGLVEATLSLAEIAARWRLVPEPGPEVRARPAMTLRAERMRMRVSRRTDSPA